MFLSLNLDGVPMSELVIIPLKGPSDVCPTGEFPCSSSGRECLKEDYWCDGEKHCPEWEDEIDCAVKS